VAEANQLVQAFVTVGGVITGTSAVIIAWGKARELANKPIEELKVALTAQLAGVKTDLSTQISTLDTRVVSLRREVDALNVHFDPNGANLRGKINDIEKRLTTLETATVNERAELKGLLTDLRPIIHELRERL
jgi:chaperonin cofactor prefoldin